MKDEKNINDRIKNLQLHHRSLDLTYCAEPFEIIPLLKEDVLKKSFPPNGIPELTELDHFFTITKNAEFVGFFRVIDLYFQGEIQLHGSYNKNTSFAVRDYFELGRIFVKTIMQMFPQKIFSATALQSNKPVQRFLSYLNFICMGPLEDNNAFYYYRKFSNYQVVENLSFSKVKKRTSIIINYYEDQHKLKKSIILKRIPMSSLNSKVIPLTKQEITKLHITQLFNVNLKILSSHITYN